MSTSPSSDPTHDFLRPARRPLDAIFSPKQIAVIGASDQPRSVGYTLVTNLLGARFGGTIFPVNPQHATVQGLACYPSISAVPAVVDLAILATPATTVPQIIEECVAAGVKAAIVLAAGFRERGPAGIALEQQVLDAAQRGNLRLLGPNCLGVMRPPTGLNATFAAGMARSGSVAFASQSGALCTAILDWSLAELVGFSAFISVGTMLDVGWGDVIDFLGDDPHTHSIILYMETIGDARSFLSAAREVALTKPIIVLKAGRNAAAAQAAASHTGALVGSDAVFDAAFRRSGVLRVDSVAELFYLAETLGKQPRPLGPRLLIVTNAGGPGVLAADALLQSGGELAELSSETIAALNQVLPEYWSHGNPVDLLGDADAERYAQALAIVARERSSDGLLVIRTPQVSAEPAQVAAAVAAYAKLPNKPVLANWMGGAATASGTETLNQANIPTFSYPDTAARMFSAMWSYSDNLRSLYETPSRAEDEMLNRVLATETVQRARDDGRTLLNLMEVQQVLAAYGIPQVETRYAASVEQAVAHADALGYPIVLKLASATITHKSDVGGVRLQLMNADAVRDAYHAIASGVPAEEFLGVTVQPMMQPGYELIIGSTIDAQFGPVLLCGAGGQLVEVLEDQSLGLPPLTTTLARRMIEQTRIFNALQGVRGRPASDLRGLEELLVRFSYLVIEQPWIKEIDINPLWVAFDTGRPSLLALDARIVLHESHLTPEELPKPAIRPYPTQYVMPWTLNDGTPVTIRPIRPEDEPLLVQFHQALSERSVFMRYFAPLSLSARTAHERLTKMCFIDYDREMALVVDREDPVTGDHSIIAVGRLIKLYGKNDAEYAGLVSDQFQGHGLGTEVLRQLIRVARDEGLARIVAETLPENRGMQRVFEKLGFRLKHILSDHIVEATLDL